MSHTRERPFSRWDPPLREWWREENSPPVKRVVLARIYRPIEMCRTAVDG